tara:strand:+ start:200 stop:457 length:258 start_codon:yes stop_codon:yes gene_type:complete
MAANESAAVDGTVGVDSAAVAGAAVSAAPVPIIVVGAGSKKAPGAAPPNAPMEAAVDEDAVGISAAAKPAASLLPHTMASIAGAA